MSESENYLTTLPRFSELGAGAIKPGLDRVTSLLEALGNPHDSLTIIHVGGTNGKGTTSSLISSILTASGYSVGLFTSPHISSVRERFRINGKPIEHDALDRLVEELTPVFDREEPSFFEAVTVAAALYFARAKVDAAVVEVGLGGRLDATNVVSPIATVITQVDMDHMDILGDTLEEIAQEKAGIIKQGVPVVTGATDTALAVIKSAAKRVGSPVHSIDTEVTISNIRETIGGARFDLHTPAEDYTQLALPLAGSHQLSNASLAVRCVELISDSFNVSKSSITKGLSEVREYSGLSSRIDLVRRKPLVILDVSHNTSGIGAALEHITRHLPDKRISVAMSIMKDKDVDGVMQAVAQYDVQLLFVRLAQVRAATPEYLSDVARRYGKESAIIESLDGFVRKYVADASDDEVLVLLGSHLLIEQARHILN
ncbi:MAG: bifunctional folylpolyglutamate synthase/dihydrofolate synthase [Rhodothermales bacterium]|nr:bifunctional folylpolyglutamate synthase/dihydrofolate synthase [Rhodothermales bacterium]